MKRAVASLIVLFLVVFLPVLGQLPLPGGGGGMGGGAAGGLNDPGGNGIVVRTALNTTTNRSIAVGSGITVTNADGTAGNPTVSPDTSVLLTRATNQANSSLRAASTTGNDTYVATMSPVVTVCSEGMTVYLVPDTANTGAATLDIGCGAKSIKQSNGTLDPVDGEIPGDSHNGIWLTYDATNTVWRLPASVPLQGAVSLATGAIASATCAAAVTGTATGITTKSTVSAVFAADPTAVTGYVPLTSGMLTIIAYPTANTVNFKVCNNTSGSITPGAITLNWSATL